MSPTDSPLLGRRVVITRAAGQAPALADRLCRLGAIVVEVPAIAIQPLASTAELAAAAARLRGHPASRWLAVTSANTVARLGELRPHEDLGGVGIAAVGNATAAALGRLGLEVRLVAAEASAASLGDALIAAGAGSGSVWLPQAEAADPGLADRLRRAGAVVEVTVCYRTAAPAGLAQALGAALDAGVDALTLFSGSAVDNIVAAVGAEALRATPLICAGPVTAAAVRRHGLTPVIAAGPGAEGVAAALVDLFSLL